VAGRVRRAKAPEDAQRVRVVGKNGHVQHHRGAQAQALIHGGDTALRLLRDIKEHRVDTATLTVDQRRSCLLLLANGSQTSAELASVFKVGPSTIRMDLKRLRETIGREVQEWTLQEVLGQLALSAEKCTSLAMKEEDPGLAWTIQRDFAKLLKEFGVIGSSEDRSGFKLTIEGIGEGYERARLLLGQALDPRLTGEVVINTESSVVPPLPLSRALTGEVGGDPLAGLLDPATGAPLLHPQEPLSGPVAGPGLVPGVLDPSE